MEKQILKKRSLQPPSDSTVYHTSIHKIDLIANSLWTRVRMAFNELFEKEVQFFFHNRNSFLSVGGFFISASWTVY